MLITKKNVIWATLCSQNMFAQLQIGRDKVAHTPVATCANSTSTLQKKSIWGSYYHHIQLWKCSSENIALLKEVREIRLGLEIRGQACCWRLFVWISNCETWKMWSLTKCDISGLMLLIWCVKWCRMCHLQCTEQILLANQDRCNQIRWWILLGVYTFFVCVFTFLHSYKLIF